MSCSSAFAYSVTDTTELISSSQSVSCKGSVTVPSYSVPGVKMCAWYPSGWGSFSCKWDVKWKKSLKCDWGVVKWSQSCWTTPSVQIWPSTTISGAATVDTKMSTDEVVTYNQSGPSQTYTYTLTIDSIYLTVTVAGLSINYTIANDINCVADSDGSFSATIDLTGFTYNYSGVSASFTNTILLCPTPSGGAAWLNVTSNISFSYLGYSANASLLMPIT